MRRITFIIFILILSMQNMAFSQVTGNDSLIDLLKRSYENDPEVKLIQSGNYSGAHLHLSNEISQDESDREAYFKRGVVNWALKDTLNACRDWSSVLALGDTEMFNLLESKCHSSMIIEEDTLSSKQYKKLWSRNGANTDIRGSAMTLVEEMPEFRGGEEKLIAYLKSSTVGRHDMRGTVYVNFIISPSGKIMFPYVTRGINKTLDKEALEIIRNMPPWTPGKEKGKAVYVRSNLPVRF